MKARFLHAIELKPGMGGGAARVEIYCTMIYRARDQAMYEKFRFSIHEA